MKRLQNKVAESRHTLPVTMVYATVIWLVAGLVEQQWWAQFACFLASIYLMAELNNSNALIRIYSRTVSAAFVLLTCCIPMLFVSLKGFFTQLCLVASLLMFFQTYQDRESPGHTFYTFLFLSLPTLVAPEVLLFLPVYWLVMAFTLYSASWRNFSASVLGLLTPYWVVAAWILLMREGDFSLLSNHLMQLGELQAPFTLNTVGWQQTAFLVLILVLTITGVIHYVRTSFHDRIRIRQLYYCMMILNAAAVVLFLLQPQYFDSMSRMMIITTSTLIAHFVSLTRTRVTNVSFVLIVSAILVLTGLNLWMLLLPS